MNLQALFAQLADDGKAVHARQHHVKQHQVERAGSSEPKTFFSVIGKLDGMALTLQGAADVARKRALVLHNQNLHEPST